MELTSGIFKAASKPNTNLNQSINRENQVGLFLKKNKTHLLCLCKVIDFFIKKIIMINLEWVHRLAFFIYGILANG